MIGAAAVLASCSGNPKSGQEELTAMPENALEYNYEPEISTLSGTLTSRIYWGPPGYGEDTTVDEKEQAYILVLSKGIDMKAPKKDLSDGYNAAIHNVMKVQIVPQNLIDEYLNKPVTVTGTLFGAQTGHHHSDVLMDLKTIR